MAKLLPRRLNVSMLYQVGLAITLVCMIGVGVMLYMNGSAAGKNVPDRDYPPVTERNQTTFAERTAIFWADFDRLEARPVSLVTNPPNAKVAFFPVDVMNVPNHERAVIAGSNQGNVELKPGNYLVVAELKDGNFSEVHRRVPRMDENCYSKFNHACWKIEDGTVVLPTINIVPFDNSEMVLCDGFWIDKELVSEKQFLSVTQPNSEDISKMSLNPTLGIDHESALNYCELLGRRLPTVEELMNASDEIGFHLQPELREWTSTSIDNVYDGRIFNPLYATWSLESAIPTEKTASLDEYGFRTVRSAKPLLEISNK